MTTEIATRHETPVTIQDSATIMEVISRAASDPNTDIDKLERLMGMYERLETKKAETAFHAAMTAAQSEMGRVSTDALNTQTRSRYATYGKLDKALRPIYTQHGFSLSFGTDQSPIEQHVRVLCDVSHRAGYSKQYHIDMPNDGKGAKGGDVMTKTHAQGAATRYGMRYLLTMIFNVAIGEDDNDGNTVEHAEKISASELADLIALCEEVNADKAAFCKVLRVESLAELPKSKLKGAVDRLNQKRRAK